MEIIEKQVEKVKEVPADNYGYNLGQGQGIILPFLFAYIISILFVLAK